MKFTIGAAFVALASLAAPAMAQTAAPTAAATPKAARLQCKQEAVTGSFTRKVRQCRTVRAPAATANKPAQPAPAAAAAATPPASTPSQSSDVDASASATKGL